MATRFLFIATLRSISVKATCCARSEQALVAVIQEAWIGVVSARRLDELVQAMRMSGIFKKHGVEDLQGHR